MNNNEQIDIFTKPGDLMFAPYWGKVEEYLRRHSFNKNINELLIVAMEEEVAKLKWVMLHLIAQKGYEKIVDKIFKNAMNEIVSRPEISAEDLYSLILKNISLLLNNYIDNENDSRMFAVAYIDIFVRNFIRLKEGADIFCDLMFSNEMITAKLESDNNINALFVFISALGPNLYFLDYID